MRHQPDLLFVYGTLMRGGRLHSRLEEAGALYLGRGQIRGKLYRIPGENYPGAVPSADWHDRVYGELYRLLRPLENLRVLDEVEGCGEGLFRREMVVVQSAGAEHRAWTYFYARPLENAALIRSGRYRPLAQSR